jgi:hypothetical protein
MSQQPGSNFLPPRVRLPLLHQFHTDQVIEDAPADFCISTAGRNIGCIADLQLIQVSTG